MSDQIVWIVLFPLLGAVLCSLLGIFNKRFCYSITVLAMVASVWASIDTLMQAMESPVHEVAYFLGGWAVESYPRGVGIEFRADILGGLIALVVTGVGLIVALYSKVPVQRQTPWERADVLQPVPSADNWSCWYRVNRGCF